MEGGHFSALVGWLKYLYLPPIRSSKTEVSSRVLLSCSFSVILQLHSGCKEWFTDLLALLVEGPLELPMLSYLLVRPSARKFHWGLESFCLHTWNCEAARLEARFFKEFVEVLLQTSKDPRHASIRESDPDSSDGVVEVIFLLARLLFSS